MRTDKLFYKLFQAFPELLFQLTGQSADLAGAYRFASVEVKELAFRIDGLFEPRAGFADCPIQFVEVQFQKDADFYWRFLTEILLYLGQYKLDRPWRATVFWQNRDLDDGDIPLPYQAWVKAGNIQRIYLDELALKPADSLGAGIVQFIVAAEAEAETQIEPLFQQVRETLKDLASQQQVIELIEKAVIYKFPQKDYQELAAMFTQTDWEQTQFYKDVQQKTRLETQLNNVPKLLKIGLTLEQIASVLDLDIDIVRKVAQSQDLD